RHPELFTLAIAHVDADAFYASIEKRDAPELQARPVIVGGGRRGVVAACCYLARARGVRSAMPMFKALAACPEAVVIRPDMAKYAREAQRIRALMAELTPAVEILSIDEAVLDLSGTEALHRAPPAVVLARLARRIEQEVGVTVSIGLGPNRLLAKIAAGRDKPRGFTVIGRAEAAGLLAPEPVSLLPGIGPAMERRLAGLGITRLGQLAALSPAEARARLGEEGPRLAAYARGEDDRPVRPDRPPRGLSAETTFEVDLSALPALEAELWRMAERLARRLGEKDLAAAGIVLKLKRADFLVHSRSLRLPAPTRVPERLFAAARPLLAREADGQAAFRLIGLAAAPLAPGRLADPPDLAEPEAARQAARWAAVETLRRRFGEAAVVMGRSLRAPRRGG
ncbi:MAG: DNA polymerase IV, partial [Rhodovarius sp.]|nr:DNA polymerase IV [Rhodovarius sp.]